MSEEKQVAVAKPLPVVADSGEFSMLMDTNKFAQLQRIGTMYARSKMVPAHFQGDEPSCMVAVQMAMRLNIDPFMFLQKTYVVQGKPGMEATLVIALINTRGPFKGPIDWNVERDNAGKVIKATAFATHRETGRVCEASVTWEMVQAEGWDKKSGSKWLTLREQMFKYRSATFLGRLYCPEVLMGMSEAGELEEIDITPQPTTDAAPRRGLKDRVVGETPIQGTATRVEDAPPPAQEAAQGAGATPEGQKPLIGPAIPFAEAMALAKKAKNPDQGDIVLDALNDPGYTPEERAQVKAILDSKIYHPTAA